jgi:hypothetical protein
MSYAGYTSAVSRTIPAVFESGVFRPLAPVDWPDGTRAEVIPVVPATAPPSGTAGGSATWPPDYFDQTSGALAGEDFERPPQGDLPQRQEW